MLFYDLHMKKYFEPTPVHLEWRGILGIYNACWPLFVSSFIMNYLNNAPKYAINTYYDETVQNSYNILFMPAFVINLLSLFVFRPLLTDLARDWEGENIKEFTDIVKKMMILNWCTYDCSMCGCLSFGNTNIISCVWSDLRAYRMEWMFI